MWTAGRSDKTSFQRIMILRTWPAVSERSQWGVGAETHFNRWRRRWGRGVQRWCPLRRHDELTLPTHVNWEPVCSAGTGISMFSWSLHSSEEWCVRHISTYHRRKQYRLWGTQSWVWVTESDGAGFYTLWSGKDFLVWCCRDVRAKTQRRGMSPAGRRAASRVAWGITRQSGQAGRAEWPGKSGRRHRKRGAAQGLGGLRTLLSSPGVLEKMKLREEIKQDCAHQPCHGQNGSQE